MSKEENQPTVLEYKSLILFFINILFQVPLDIFTSKKISIKYESGKGRYATASEAIQSGETLVVEKPYAACLLPEMFGTHCHHCFER